MAALTPASPNIVVAASVTSAVAPIFTTLTISKISKTINHIHSNTTAKKQL